MGMAFEKTHACFLFDSDWVFFMMVGFAWAFFLYLQGSENGWRF